MRSTRTELVSVADLRELANAMDCRTQAQLADKLGITQARVSQILSGRYPVKRGSLMQLIRTLQVTHRSETPKAAHGRSQGNVAVIDVPVLKRARRNRR